MDSIIQVHMAKGKPQSSPAVAIWASRAPRHVVAVLHRLDEPRSPYTRTGSHNDGNHAAPTSSQAQPRFSAAPHADGKGRGRSQGALKGPQCEFIDLDHRSMNSLESLKPLRGVPSM